MPATEQTVRMIAEGWEPGIDQVEELMESMDTETLREVADRLRRELTGDGFDTCSIMNARSGRCSENCKWCSQSVYHNSEIDIYPLVTEEQALEAARYNEEKGVRRFSLVTSGRAMTDAEIDKACGMIRKIGERHKIELCVSMGLLNKEQLRKLFDAGIGRYHCNLETAPSFFPELCTTHSTEDKMRTIQAAREVGMEICSGGIIGMGETMRHRIELAITLRDMKVMSIPVNILNPIKGTSLEGTAALSDDEILRSVAMFRIVNPRAYIRFAGGRILVRHLQDKLLRGGVNASIVGDMLTTAGCDVPDDMDSFRRAGYRIIPAGEADRKI